MGLVHDEKSRSLVFSQPSTLSLVGFYSGILYPEALEKLLVLLFQLVPMHQYKAIPCGSAHHLGKQIGLSCSAGCYHQHPALAIFEGQYCFLIKVLLIITEHLHHPYGA
jgi:hypothetical protein